MRNHLQLKQGKVYVFQDVCTQAGGVYRGWGCLGSCLMAEAGLGFGAKNTKPSDRSSVSGVPRETVV